jgi:hypothetical protein
MKALVLLLVLSGCMHTYAVELGFPPTLSCHGLGCPEKHDSGKQ